MVTLHEKIFRTGPSVFLLRIMMILSNKLSHKIICNKLKLRIVFQSFLYRPSFFLASFLSRKLKLKTITGISLYILLFSRDFKKFILA